MKAVLPLPSTDSTEQYPKEKVEALQEALWRIGSLLELTLPKLPEDEKNGEAFGDTTLEWVNAAFKKLFQTDKDPKAKTVTAEMAAAINERLVGLGAVGKLIGRLVNGREGSPGARPPFKRPGMLIEAVEFGADKPLGRAVTGANDEFVLFVDLRPDQEASRTNRKPINISIKPAINVQQTIGMTEGGVALSLYNLPPGLLRPDVVSIEADPNKVRAEREYDDVLGQAQYAIKVLGLPALPQLTAEHVKDAYNLLQQNSPSATPATVPQLEHMVIAQLLFRDSDGVYGTNPLQAQHFYGLLRTDRLLYFTWRLDPALTARTGIRLSRYQDQGGDEANRARRRQLLVDVAFYSKFLGDPSEGNEEAAFGTSLENELGIAVSDFVGLRISAPLVLNDDMRTRLANARLRVLRDPDLKPLVPKEPFYRKVDGTESIWSSAFESQVLDTEVDTAGLPEPLRKLLKEPTVRTRTDAQSDDAPESFDFRSGDVRALAKKAGWSRVALGWALAYQRVLRLTQDSDAIAFLFTKQADGRDLSSASRVRHVGLQRFVRAYVAHMKGRVNANRNFQQEASQLYARATRRAELSSHVAGEVRSLLTASDVAAFRNKQTSRETVVPPTWSAIFGSADSVACNEADSIHGQASYLVDVLQYFKRLDSTDVDDGPAQQQSESSTQDTERREGERTPAKANAKTVFDVLMARRPDIGYLDLNSANTLTAVPRIDLVNELLEDRVQRHVLNLQLHVEPGAIDQSVLDALRAAGAGWPKLTSQAVVTVDSRGNRLVRDRGILLLLERNGANGNCPIWLARELRQTYGTAEELGAMPEHRNRHALALLKTSVSSLALPYDDDRDLAAGYLKKLGSPRWRLILALTPSPDGPAKPTPTSPALVRELLDMTEAEFSRIAHEDVAHQSEFWGISANELIKELSRLEVFLAKTGLKTEPITDSNLSQLLRCDFIHGSGSPLREVAAEPGDSVAHRESTRRRIEGLTAAVVDRLHRFLRLQRCVAWPLTLVDRLICSPRLGRGVLDEACLEAMAESRLLANGMGLKTDVVASWFAALDVHGETPSASPYGQVFLQRTGNYEPFLPEQLRAASSGRAVPTLRQHDKFIASALGVPLRDVGLVLDGWRDSGTGEVPLNIESLSKCWAWFQFAKRLGWPAADLLQLLPMLGQADAIGHPAQARVVWHAVTRLKKWGLNIRDLQYWIKGEVHASLESTAPELSQAILATALKQLRAAFLRVESESASLLIAPNGRDDKAECIRKLTEALGKVPGLQPDQLEAVLAAVQLHSDVKSVVTAVQASSSLASIPGLVDAVAENKLPKSSVWTEDDDSPRAKAEAPPRPASPAPEVPVQSSAGESASHREHRQWVAGVIKLIVDDAQTRDQREATHRVLATQLKAPTDLLQPILENLHGEDESQTLIQTIADSGWHQTQAVGYLEELLVEAFERDDRSSSASSTQVEAFRAAVIRGQAISDWQPIERLALVQALAAKWQRVAQAIRKVHKASLFAKVTRMDAGVHLGWGLTPADGFGKTKRRPFDALGWFSPDHLGIKTVRDEDLPKRFGAWLHLMMGLDLIRAFPLSASVIDPSEQWGAVSILERAARTQDLDSQRNGPSRESLAVELFDALSRVVGKPASTLRTLSKQLGQEAASFVRPLASVQLIETYEALESIGFPISQADLDELAGVEVTEHLTSTLMECLKRATPAETWLATLKEVHDPLRSSRRDALVAYLTADPKNSCFRDENDLWNYFLTDPRVAPCEPSSRIRDAMYVVKTFGDRCKANQEASVDPRADDNDGDDWREWDWMGNYRLWEANRKIFLYPENWLEPGLRDDKSEFFREFEQAIQQGDMTELSLMSATEAYLARLDDSAFLEVVAIHYQDQRPHFERGREEGYVLHVVARTKGGEPGVYYYRRFKGEREWTPWERIDLDIVTENPLLVERNGRLMLMWPVFTDMVDDVVEAGQYPTKENPPPPAPRGWSIQLAVSERVDGRWSAKRVSKDRITTIKVRATVERMGAERRRCKFMTRNLEPVGDYAPGVNDVRDGKGFFVLAFGYLKADGNANLLPSEAVVEPELLGVFSLSGGKGYPIALDAPTLAKHRGNLTQSGLSVVPQVADAEFETQRWVEQGKDLSGDLTLHGLASNNLTRTTVLKATPGTFKITSVQQTTVADRSVLKTLELLDERPEGWTPGGLFTPWFYEDGHRGYVVVPTFRSADGKGAWRDQTISALLPAINRFWQDVNAQTGQWNGVIPTVLPIEWKPLADALSGRLGLRFIPFQHPKTGDLKRALAEGGLERLMGFSTIFWDRNEEFENTFGPQGLVLQPYPNEFSALAYGATDGYASYNWELFYHLPSVIADKLLRDGQQEGAIEWLHYIFNPTGISSKAKDYGPTAQSKQPSKVGLYWQFEPFRSRFKGGDSSAQELPSTPDSYADQSIASILSVLTSPGDDARAQVAYLHWTSQVEQWRTNPFMPFQIARGRTVAFQKATFMRYLDTLIAQGDALFRRGSVDGIEQARQIYKTVQDLLGPRPMQMKPLRQRPTRTFRELEVLIAGEGPFEDGAHGGERGGFDDFGNSLVELENLLPADAGSDEQSSCGCPASQPVAAQLSKSYFCIPRNPKLVGYWDTVEDRLYKIRNCLDIDGAQRSMALFDPPIDPGLLAKAASSGVSLGDAWPLSTGPAPVYRFQVLMQKATELAQMVIGFGATLLQTIEKRDAEGLAQLRTGQELGLLKLVRDTRVQELKEARQAKFALEQARLTAKEREDFYAKVERISGGERFAKNLNAEALNFERTGLPLSVAGSLSNMIGTLSSGVAGFGGTAQVSYAHGGANLGASQTAMGAYFSGLASMTRGKAYDVAVEASYERRWADWKLQERLASKEVAQIDAQIAAADIRIQIAESQLKSHDLQVEQSAEVLEYIKGRKFSTADLYDWMKDELGSLYFQAWKLASRFALNAERAFHHEIGPAERGAASTSYIRTDTWDGLRKGALAGEKLLFDLKALDEAYLTLNRRELNLIRHVSLARLSPLTFLTLMRKGVCEFDVPEWLFDMSYPGHYFRRISSVSISVPGVVGPYAGINSTLTLLKHSIRTVPDACGEDDQKLKHDFSRTQSIATSTAQDDSGVFEISYADDRTRPFERAGAISRWRLELNRADNRELDFESITDVVLHIRYTARDGGQSYRQERRTLVDNFLTQGLPGPEGSAGPAPLIHRLFFLDHDFPAEWHRFATTKDAKGRRSLQLSDLAKRMPYVWPGLADKAARVTLVRLDGDQEVRRFKLVDSDQPDGNSWEDVPLSGVEFSVEALDAEPRLGLIVSCLLE